MTLDIQRIQASCFDVDGTLSDTDDVWVASLERRVLPLRRIIPRGDTHAFARWAIMCAESPGNLLYHILDRFDLDDDVGRVYSYICKHQVGKKPKTFWEIDGVCEMLACLHARYPMAVVSAGSQTGTRAFLDQFGLTGYFQAIATAQTCRFTKPFPDPVWWAAAQMGVAPENCLMVGDTSVDIRAGKSAGAQTVGVLCGFGQEHELRRAGADLILSNTAALLSTLIVE
jgi:N-acetyl-D-muramate 6-phosphate phosphatase